MKKILFSISISIHLLSCAPTANSPKLTTTEIRNVELNQNLDVSIGDILIEKGLQVHEDAVQIIECPSDITFNFGKLKYPYKAGDILPLWGSYQFWDLYCFKQEDKNNKNTNSTFGVAVHKKDKTIVRPFELGNNGCIIKERKNFSVKPTTYIKSCRECYKQQLIFNGKANNNLKFIYKEFTTDLELPIYTQEFQYDLSKTNIIPFEELSVEIIETSNTNISYQVTTNPLYIN